MLTIDYSGHNLRYNNFVSKVLGCLAFCTGDLELDLRLSPPTHNTRLTYPVSNVGFSTSRLPISSKISVHVTSLQIKAQNINDEDLVVRVSYIS